MATALSPVGCYILLSGHTYRTYMLCNTQVSVCVSWCTCTLLKKPDHEYLSALSASSLSHLLCLIENRGHVLVHLCAYPKRIKCTIVSRSLNYPWFAEHTFYSSQIDLVKRVSGLRAVHWEWVGGWGVGVGSQFRTRIGNKYSAKYACIHCAGVVHDSGVLSQQHPADCSKGPPSALSICT